MCYVTCSWKKPDSVKKLEEFKLGKKPTGSLLEITSRCNIDCVYCYCNPKKDKKDMSFENVKRTIDILSKSPIKQVTLTGGEPLLHPKIEDIVKYASDSGLITHICSNGYLLTKDLANKFAKNGLSQIQVDIAHTRPDFHDYLRGKSGSFEKAKNALLNAKKYGITTVATIVLHNKNKDVVNDIIKYARNQINVDRIRIINYMPIGISMKELILEDYAFNLEKITEFVAGLGASHLISFEPTFSNKKHKSKIETIHIPCPNKDAIFTNIKNNGDVIFCACASRDNILYNIFDFNGEELERIHTEKIKEFLRNNRFKDCLV